MSGRRVGICSVCETKQKVGRASHNTEHASRGDVVVYRHTHPTRGQPFGCKGAGMRPALTFEQHKRTIGRLALVEPFRPYAAVALDAWTERRPYPQADVEVLCEVAVREYSLRRPEASEIDVLRYVARQRRDRSRGNTGDCYCVFCGVLVVRGVSGMTFGMQRENLRKLRWIDRHPVECALKHLAFALQPASPLVRRLPDEYMQEAEAP